MALSVLLYIFRYGQMLCQNKMGGAFMNTQQLQQRLNELLEKLKQNLPEAERISLVEDIKEILSAFFPAAN